MSDKIRVTMLLHPFKSDKDIRYIDRMSFDAMYEEFVDKKYPKDYVVFYDLDTKVSDWSKEPEHGEVIMRVLPYGTEEGQIQNSGKTALGAGFLGLALGLATIASGGTIWIAAGLLGLGAVFTFTGIGILTSKGEEASENQPEKQRAYSLRGGKNQKLSGFIPILLGRHLVFPSLAAKPYTKAVDGQDTQYYYQTMIAGYDHMTIDTSTLKFGETPISALPDIDYSPNNAYYGDNRVNEENIYTEVRQDEDSISRFTCTNTRSIEIDILFPNGVYYKDGNEYKAHTVTFSVQYRPIGGSWTTIVSSAGTGSISETTIDAFRKVYTYTFDNLDDTDPDAVGNLDRQYEIRVTRVQYDDNNVTWDNYDGNPVSTFLWTTLKSYTGVFDSGTFDPLAIDATTELDLSLLDVRVKASEQYNNQVDRISAEYQTVVDYSWNGASWVASQVSNNPADLFRFVLQNDKINKHPVANAKIDLTALEVWHDYCSDGSRDYTFNAYITKETSIAELLTMICAAGRATWMILDGVYTVKIDTTDTTIVQHFTPRNSWNFQGTKAFNTVPTRLDMKFVNKDSGYVEETRPVYYNNVVDNSEVQEVQLFGITDSDHAWKIGDYLHKNIRLRPERFTFSADVEAIVCTKGDRIKLQHDVPLIGLHSGRISSLTVDGGLNITGFESDEIIQYEVGKSYAVRIRKSDLSAVELNVTNLAVGVDVSSTSVQFQVAQAPGSLDEQLLFMFGEQGSTDIDLIVESIETTDNLEATITAMPYADGLEIGTPDAYDPKISKPSGNAYPIAPIPSLPQMNPEYNRILGGVAGVQSIELRRSDAYSASTYEANYVAWRDNDYIGYANNENGDITYETPKHAIPLDGGATYRPFDEILHNRPLTHQEFLSSTEMVGVATFGTDYLYYVSDFGNSAADVRITDDEGIYPKKLNDTEILYINTTNSNNIYRKSNNTLSDGTLFFALDVNYFCVISETQIVYSSTTNADVLYLKDTGVGGNGTAITTQKGIDPQYYNGYIYYINPDDDCIYRTTTADADDGVKLFTGASAISLNSSGDVAYIDSTNSKVWIGLNNNQVPGSLTIPIHEADTAFVGTVTNNSNVITPNDVTTLDYLRRGDIVQSTNLPENTVVTFVDTVSFEVSNKATATNASEVIYYTSQSVWLDQNAVYPGSITETRISDDAISTPKLQANAVIADKIAANAIETDKINAEAVTAVKINLTNLYAQTVSVTGILSSSNYVSNSNGWRINGNGELEINELTARGTMQSSNYVADTTGWIINNDGTAEFNSVTVRGTIDTSTLSATGNIQSSNYVADTSGWIISGDGSAQFSNLEIRGTSSFAGTMNVATISASGTLSSNNFSAGTAGWRIEGDGDAEFNTGVFRGTLGVNTVEASGSIGSNNYSAGTAGWQIDGDGDAEFNNVTIRGTLGQNTVESGGHIQSSNFSTGVSGYQIDGDGNAEFNSIDARGTMQSTTYTSSSAGWQINADGSAEFNNGTFRGTLGVNTIEASGELKSSNYVASTSGWIIDGDGSAEFSDLDIRGTSTFAGTMNVADISASGSLSSSNFSTGVSGWQIHGDGSGEFSNITVRGSSTFSGSLSAASGTFAGALSASTGNFNTLTVNASGWLRSSNFSTGSAGWEIDGDGDVEFNSGTFRGALDAVTGNFGAVSVSASGSITCGNVTLDADGIKAASLGFTLTDALKSIGGWLITTDSIQSAADGNARLEMNPGDNRFEVWASSGLEPKVAMGYLGGLSDPSDRLSDLPATAYGFWSAENDTIQIQGELEADTGGFMSIKNDGYLEIRNTTFDQQVLFLGPSSGVPTLNFYESNQLVLSIDSQGEFGLGRILFRDLGSGYTPEITPGDGFMRITPSLFLSGTSPTVTNIVLGNSVSGGTGTYADTKSPDDAWITINHPTNANTTKFLDFYDRTGVGAVANFFYMSPTLAYFENDIEIRPQSGVTNGRLRVYGKGIQTYDDAGTMNLVDIGYVAQGVYAQFKDSSGDLVALFSGLYTGVNPSVAFPKNNVVIGAETMSTNNYEDFRVVGVTGFEDYINVYYGADQLTTKYNDALVSIRHAVSGTDYNFGIVLGSVNGTGDGTSYGRIGGRHYTATEEPVTGMFIIADSTASTVSIGGGTSTGNNATEVAIHASANSTTTGAAKVASFVSTGASITGTLTSSGKLTVSSGGIDVYDRVDALNSTDSSRATLRSLAGTGALISLLNTGGSEQVSIRSYQAAGTTQANFSLGGVAIGAATVTGTEDLYVAGTSIFGDKLTVSSGGAEFGGVNPEVIVESTDASTPTLTLRNETIGASNVFYKFQKRTDNKLLIFGFDGTTVKNVLEHTYSTGATEFSGKLTVSSGGISSEGDFLITGSNPTTLTGQYNSAVVSIKQESSGGAGADNFGIVLGLQDTGVTGNNSSRIGFDHYTDTEEPVVALFGSMTSGSNILNIGGGTAYGNNATEVAIHASANSTTTGAAKVASFVSTGASITGTLTSSGKLTVSSGGADIAGNLNVSLQINSVNDTDDGEARLTNSQFLVVALRL
jgi:hypothetical protein